MNKKLVIFTIISLVLAIFGIFHIPLLSLMGLQFPERNMLWGLSILPTVVLFCIPFIYCLTQWKKRKK